LKIGASLPLIPFPTCFLDPLLSLERKFPDLLADVTACMNGDGSKLHEILLKYKMKFRSIDLELRQPLQSHYAGAAPVAVFAVRCPTQEDA
jgi:hypothetical protein